MNQAVATTSRRAGMLAAMTAGAGMPQPPRVSIAAQRFTLIDAGGNKLPLQLFDQHTPGGFYLDVVIIDVNAQKGRVYYDKPFNPADETPPSCFSEDSIRPSPGAAVVQNPTCAGCPQSVWGSKVSLKGTPIPACSEHRNLAVIVVSDQIPPAAQTMAFRFKIPPASLKNISDYGKMLSKETVEDESGRRQADPADVITRIYFDQENQGELLFHMIGFAKHYEPLIESIYNTGVLDTIVGRADPSQAALPAPVPQQALPAPSAQPAPMQMQAPPPAPPAQPSTHPYPAPQAFQQNGGIPQAAAPPAPRTRRGGARTGAGRPVQQPGPAPIVAPFQQAAAPQAFQQAAPAPVHFQAAPPAPSGQMPDMPAFLQRQQPAAPPQGAPAFGMQNGPAPDPALTSAIEAAFGQPLTPRAQ